LLGILAVALLNAGVWKWSRHRDHAAEERARYAAAGLRERQRPPEAPAAPPDPGFLGVVLLGESVELEPKVEGRVQAVFVKPGDQVARGARIAALDVKQLEEELTIAKAGYHEARRRLARRLPLARGLAAVTPEE